MEIKKVDNLRWAILRLDGEPLHFTLRGIRKDSIRAISECLGESWARLYWQGYRCAKVNIYIEQL